MLKGKLRTPHSLDIPLVFDNVAASTSLVGDDLRAPQKVADAVSAEWIALARDGSPNGPGLAQWRAYDPKRRAASTRCWRRAWCRRLFPELQRRAFPATSCQAGLVHRPQRSPMNWARALRSPFSCQSSHASTARDHSRSGAT